MSARVVITRAAAADISAAYDWYEGQQKGLGSGFLDEIEAALARISDRPTLYPFAVRDARRVLVRRFPYSIYFRLRGDQARILAVMHQSRDPRAVQRRVR